MKLKIKWPAILMLPTLSANITFSWEKHPSILGAKDNSLVYGSMKHLTISAHAEVQKLSLNESMKDFLISRGVRSKLSSSKRCMTHVCVGTYAPKPSPQHPGFVRIFHTSVTCLDDWQGFAGRWFPSKPPYLSSPYVERFLLLVLNLWKKRFLYLLLSGLCFASFELIVQVSSQ